MLAAGALAAACAGAHADVADLDAGLPTEVADAVTAEPGARELQLRLRWDRDRTGANELYAEADYQLGLAERWHAAIASAGSPATPTAPAAVWMHNAAPAPEERADRGRFIAGYSVLIGDRTALIFDVVRQHERRRGAMSNLVEAGVRQAVHWLARDATASLGIGHGWGAESAPRFRLVAGLEVPF